VQAGELAGRKRVVLLSKGHASLALYSWLVAEGKLSKEELLRDFCKPGSALQAHPEARRARWALVSSGSLGQGLSIANGLALAARVKKEQLDVAVVLGDGELDEGQVWEAAATAATYGLDNVLAIVDRNMSQHTGPTEEVKRKEPLKERWFSFGWNVISTRNSLPEIVEALAAAELLKGSGKPTAILVYPRPSS